MAKTKSLIYCGLFTALIAAGAFIKVPVPVVPFTEKELLNFRYKLCIRNSNNSLS